MEFEFVLYMIAQDQVHAMCNQITGSAVFHNQLYLGWQSIML